jgi:hypothetical protein
LRSPLAPALELPPVRNESLPAAICAVVRPCISPRPTGSARSMALLHTHLARSDVALFAAFSDGRRYKPPNAFEKIRDKLAKVQRQLARSR